MGRKKIITSWLEKCWQFLLSRRGPTIKSADKGIFDPYLPISSLKPLSADYTAAGEQPLEESLIQETDLSSEQSPEKRGFVVFRLVVIAIVATLAIRLIDLQIVLGQQNYSLAQGNRLKTELVPAPRGLFYDRNGVPLVSNVPNFSVVLEAGAVPRKASDKANYIDHLASVLSQDPTTLGSKIKSEANLGEIGLAENLSRDEALSLQLKLNDADINGVSLVALPVRQYTSTVADLGHLLGYVGKSTAADLKNRPGLLATSYVGKNGLEEQYDQQLQGTPGINTLEVDSLGRSLRLVGSQPPQVGQSLILYLDSSLQQTTASALEASIQANHATAGAAVVIDVRTGGILAMVSEPTFDNNLFSQSGSQADRQAVLSNPLSPLLNRAIAGQYPSGSTIKPVIAAGALADGVVSATTKFDTSQPIVAGPQTFHDWKVHGISDIKQAIAQSNDIFFYTIGGGHGNIQGLGIDRLDSDLQQFGFGKKTGIDLPGEKSGNVPTPAWKLKTQGERWFLGDTYNLSIGQGGFLITPLQLANSTATIANGGTIYRPVMVKSIGQSTGGAKDLPPSVLQTNVVDASSIATVQQGMLAAVAPGGSAHSILGALPFQTGAKTGTAQITSSLTSTHAWFTAFAPYQNPEIAVAAVVEGGGEGFDVAGPIVRQIIEQYFHLPLTPIVAAAPNVG